MGMWIWTLCLMASMPTSTVKGDRDADQVFDLPGLSVSPTFNHFSGYLNAGGTKRLHYWFVESQNDPATDPLVLWLNGGPGCSSLDGFLNEHGPFLVSPDGDALTENHYSWNKVANMLYIESPAGVGFSYSLDDSYATDDDQTSLDNYNALQDFFQHYPEFANNDFYITGESYGGVYVPTLSDRVVQDETVNFKGFAVGNGICHFEMNFDSEIVYAYHHGLVGEELWRRLVEFCCPEGEFSARECHFFNGQHTECEQAYSEYSRLVSGLNHYDIYAECHTEESLAMNSMPCINATGITTYLTDEDVRHALHIPDAVQGWVLCSRIHYDITYKDVTDFFLRILDANRYKVLVYNGDADLVVNALANEWFVDSLNLTLTNEWQPWHYASPMDGSRQVAGFTKQYENLAFATVHGGSHSAPQNRPVQALALFEKFLKGNM